MNQGSRTLCRFLGLVCVTLLLLSGCAGSGEGLNGNGGDPLSPTFSSIQAHIFAPICGACHTGAIAPVGLVLDSDVTFDQLVDKPSREVPDFFLVEPGNPDDSYLIRKLEGGPDMVGFQMPPTELGVSHLSQEDIDVIRLWITEGAQDN